MKIAVQGEDGTWESRDCLQVVIPMGIESEIIDISVIDEREVVVIRHGTEYPNGGEAVWSELLAEEEDG